MTSTISTRREIILPARTATQLKAEIVKTARQRGIEVKPSELVIVWSTTEGNWNIAYDGGGAPLHLRIAEIDHIAQHLRQTFSLAGAPG